MSGSSVNREQVEGTSLILDENGNYSIVETIMVEGSGNPGASRLVQALERAGAEIGSSHPRISDQQLQSATATPETGNVIACRLNYIPRPKEESDKGINQQTRIGATLSQDTTNVNWLGNLMVVSYHPLDENGDVVLDADGNQVVRTQTGTASILLPQTTLTVTREEETSPFANAKKYVGKVNRGSWSQDPNALEYEWLCTGIDGDRPGDGDTWNVTYSFQYKRSVEFTGAGVDVNAPVQAPGVRPVSRDSSSEYGWRTKIVYRDESGQVPGDVGERENLLSIKWFEVYRVIDFNLLNL